VSKDEELDGEGLLRAQTKAGRSVAEGDLINISEAKLIADGFQVISFSLRTLLIPIPYQ
jgi:hypothetical protein